MQLLRMEPTPIEPKITDELNTTDEPELTEAEIDALLARLPKQYTYPKLLLRASPLILGCMVVVWLPATLLSLLFHWETLMRALWQLPFLAGCAFINPVVKMLVTHRERSTIMRRLVRRNPYEVVCYCLDVLNLTDGTVSPEVAAILVCFLPLLNLEESHELTERHRYRLNFLLRQKEPQLVSAALHVIAVIGDKSAISSVESLINPKLIDMIKCRDAEVLVTAQKCLVIMRERNALLTDSSVLLRASQPKTYREELLRAAAPVPETRPQELLLPSASDTQKIVL